MKKHPFIFGFLIMIFLCILFAICIWVIGNSGQLNTLMPGKDKVVVVKIEGVITDSGPVIEKLDKIKNNDDVKAVVLRIDSPGGSVAPSQEIYKELIKLREKKTIVASFGSVAASGGYYIASAAHKIIANPGSITGSIGVIIEFANIEELIGKIGLKSVVIKSGKYKDILSPTRELESAERGLIQGVIDSIHSQFIDAVALGRGMEREKVAAIADGRIFSGEQAKEQGLVDELGNLQDAIKRAAEIAGIEGEPKVIYPAKEKPSILEFLLEGSMKEIQQIISKNIFKAEYILNSKVTAK
jgi:protease-4